MQPDHPDQPRVFDQPVRPAAAEATPGVLRRRTAVVSVLAVILVSVGGYFPLTLLAPLSPATVTAQRVATPARAPAVIALPASGSSAIAAIGYPRAAGSAGVKRPLPIASLSKIVTALVALSVKPLAAGDTGPTVYFGSADAALFSKYTALNGKAEPMRAGSSLSELDLLRVVLIASANNYADKLATWSYGSESAFVSATKTWLAAHGLTNTTIVEPTGINPRNVSTPGDLIEIGKLALANPVLASIVSTKKLSLPSVGSFSNTNGLLGHSGVDGIKTGTLDNFGSSLLFAADYAIGGRSIRIIGAIVGASDHHTLYAEVKALLLSVEHGFHLVTLATAGEAFAAVRTAWDSRALAVARTNATAVAWGDTPVTSVLSTRPVVIGAKRSLAGSMTFTVGAAVVTVPLELDQAVSAPSAWWRLSHPALILRP